MLDENKRSLSFFVGSVNRSTQSRTSSTILSLTLKLLVDAPIQHLKERMSGDDVLTISNELL
jgi:hypothetical protein